MALFDKLKEKVSAVVDVDKLGEMASKTIASVKQEVNKAIDPSIKEQERQAKEQAIREAQEQERLEKEKRFNDFWASIDLDEELKYIFAVLEKSGASASNFEKGVNHMLSKRGTPVSQEEVLPTIKQELFTRAFSATEASLAMVVATDYFRRDVVNDGLLYEYMKFVISRENGSDESMQEPFIKALYGFAGYANNYRETILAEGHYQAMTSGDFENIIANNDVLKSYTDSDPFTADDVRAKWAKELCESPFKIVKASKLGSFLDNVEHVAALCYFAYVQLCVDEDSVENFGISKIVNVYLDHLTACYDEVKS